MKRGVSALSPNAARSSRTEMAGIESLTDTSGQTASSSAALVINWPGFSTRLRRTSKVFGLRWTSAAPRHNCALLASSRKGGKRRDSPFTVDRLTGIQSHLYVTYVQIISILYDFRAG